MQDLGLNAKLADNPATTGWEVAGVHLAPNDRITDDAATCPNCGKEGGTTTILGRRFHPDCARDFIAEYNAELDASTASQCYFPDLDDTWETTNDVTTPATSQSHPQTKRPTQTPRHASQGSRADQ